MLRTTLALLLTTLLFPVTAHAQAARNAAYVEIGGSAVLPSVNYERRLNERWAGRIGASWVTGESGGHTDRTLIVPLTVSWISHPESNHHLELGGGITIAAGDRQDLYDLGGNDDQFSTVLATGIIGYRYQKPGHGFQFRSAITPVVTGGEVLPWAGVSFGYAW
jgi:hypothetical protein